MEIHVHRTHRSGWLRAAVLGANDGVLSISGLTLGVIAAHTSPPGILIAGLSGLVAGSLAMGAGEYVSVSSQADTERADLNVEKNALRKEYYSEQEELRDIYISRGLDHALAWDVAGQLMAHDALGAHARDEIGITDALTARPMQASVTSAISFAAGGCLPILAHVFAPNGSSVFVISTVSLISLAALAAHAGGASLVRGAVRVLLWGALAMGVTYSLGTLF